MSALQVVLLVLIFISAAMLILSVLLQDGKNAGMGSSFGGSSEKLFGKNRVRGMQAFLQRLTIASAAGFMIFVVVLNFFSNRSGLFE